MKRNIILVLIGLMVLASIWFYFNNKINNNFFSPKTENKTVSNKEIVKNTGFLAQYNFGNLKERESVASDITVIGKALVVEQARKDLVKKKELINKTFDFETEAISFESNGKKISGMMNLPVGYKTKKSPAIIMIRGFAENQGYFIGSGSWKVADELARNGFITISLDFLGFGQSDNESTDILEARFEKPISVMDLIASVKKMDIVDLNKIGIWAHSNGGQIAVSVLEITGGNYPTVLWAPMTNPFPASVLDTIDDNSEESLKVKQKIEDFEKEYDSKLYSIDNYYDWIKAPILIHQGTVDVWCKVEWQEALRDKLKSLGKEVTLDIENDNDHNLKKSWDKVAKMDVEFFKSKFGE
jgi:dipeptidyl aminopeptidase/acylaminoacyl peptidase